MIRRYTLNFETQAMELELIDGGRIPSTFPGHPFGTDAEAKTMSVDFITREISFAMTNGLKITLELEVHPGAPRRPVVYLDQLHWVTLAQQLHSPEKVKPQNRDAASWFVAKAQAGQIILPFSSGHLVEAPLRAKQREDLATTMFHLSRGWQMRNPLNVRGEELERLFGGVSAEVSDVFTLEPGVVFGDASILPSTAGFPPDLEQLHVRITSIVAHFAAMLEDMPDDRSGPRAQAQAWADGHAALAFQMRAQRTSAEHARLNTRAQLAADLSTEIALAAARASVPVKDFAARVEDLLANELERMPYLGRYAELLYHRLRNADEKWEANDLVDMTYLACACGYADVVVGEKKTSELLKKANRNLGGGAVVFRTLPDAAEHLAGVHAVAD